MWTFSEERSGKRRRNGQSLFRDLHAGLLCKEKGDPDPQKGRKGEIPSHLGSRATSQPLFQSTRRQEKKQWTETNQREKRQKTKEKFPHTKPVTISPTKMDPSSPNTILLCTATGFYPAEIEVQWLKNGQPEEEGVAFGEELQNGDWTYQLQVMLETQPQRGDVYTCKVEHASLEAPITVQWEPRSSSSARSKLWTGIMGAVIGVAFLAVGLFSYLKSKKATPIQPPAGGSSLRCL
ncbi:rano class II histocompatibility antigen, A beta chain-like [Pituophis catenifer annectens]|uniref:rano class II histocompatibility antigen, A beta chain-like n=1 Tax=Pituophis catenifer annectens TaxID=94852 RepID=UPI0039951665